ncbi:helix-turn-helix domain-containing protein [Streptomyces silvisoli]|uniref:Helix-turn-helix domain containing protein n=1 Tax=Streptomyces silvisoli TaxID=3034235 RepID=A0ABT5ZVE8_9ACTN|nr:helix-turn-helix domain-containing protein [Streptomyces silvisoli]MDF3293794.1 helix-turn-helix domain containing protein [Streptomyces silvisoli]
MTAAKHELRARAGELRLAGKTYDEIVAELGVSRSSVSLWVRDLPKPQPSPERTRRMRKAGWESYHRRQELLRGQVKAAATAEVGPMTDRELFLVGVGLYWAEGEKDKPHQLRERVTFVNSDPDVIRVYLAWLSLLGVEAERLRFRVMIHESADVAAAERYWADLAGVGVASLDKTTLKRHNPKTVRKNVGEGYRGCFVIRVLRSADLYRRVEGWWYGIVGGASRTE